MQATVINRISASIIMREPLMFLKTSSKTNNEADDRNNNQVYQSRVAILETSRSTLEPRPSESNLILSQSYKID